MSATAYLDSPLGLLSLHGSDQGLHAVTFEELPGLVATPTAQLPECLRDAHQQLLAYFARELRAFDLVLAPLTGTDFQRRVWAALDGVAYGRTNTYLELARRLGDANAVRAVGAANGQNPLLVVRPCHRVVGAAGALTGYAGGLARKQWLLAFEQPTRQGGLFG